MNNWRLAKKAFVSEVIGNRERGKPKWRWLDGIKELLKSKRFNMDECTRLT